MLALRLDILGDFHEDIVTSIERCHTSQTGAHEYGWPLKALSPPKDTGPSEMVLAAQVVAAHFAENPERRTIAVAFEHPDASVTQVEITDTGAQELVFQLRKLLSFDRAEHDKA